MEIEFIARQMDQLHIGLMALSADIGKGQFEQGVRFDSLSYTLLSSYPDRFIPVGNGGRDHGRITQPEADYSQAEITYIAENGDHGAGGSQAGSREGRCRKPA